MLCVTVPNKSWHFYPRTAHIRRSRHDVHAAKYIKLSPFSTSLEPSFSDTRGSLNFLRLTLLCLISVSGVKDVSTLLAKKFQRRPPIFGRFLVEPYSDLQLCCVQLKTVAPSARYSTFKYPVTLKPGLGSLKVIENYANGSGTHDFLLTFHSHHRLTPISHRFRDIGHFRRKSPIFPTPRVLNAPDEWVPLGIWYRRKGSRMLL